MARTAEHEKILRVHETYKMLVCSWAPVDICEFARNKWGVDQSTAYRYMAEARERLKANLAIEEADLVAQKMATTDMMIRDELAGDEENGVTTSNRLAALQMIRTQLQMFKVI